jgi:3-oxoacyl-[acyl-carrier-protein] synthase II
MEASSSAIVVTGLGVITSLGASVEETWRGVLEGRCGIGAMEALEQRPVPDKGGGQAVEIPAAAGATDHSRAARYLRLAVEQALSQAGLLAAAGPRAEVAAVMGTTLHGMRAAGDFLRTNNSERLRAFLAGSVLDEALADFGVGPVRLTTCSACSSGLGSVALGVTLLRAGSASAVLVGGYDAVSEYAYAGFDSLRLIAQGRPRPFDVARDGMKVGEGYGVFVMEPLELALARGTRPLALVAGVGETSDSFHLTQPHPEGEGAARAIVAALANAGFGPEALDMIAAHATATPNNDAAEYRALARALGARLPDVPVVAYKGHIGHTLGAAGAVELALSIMALRAGVVPPTAGTEQVDPAFEGLRLVRQRPLERPIHVAANLSLGFGGANTCVVVSDPARVPSAVGRTSVRIDPVITGVGAVLPGWIGAGVPDRASSPPAPQAARSIADGEFEHLLIARRSRRMSEYTKLTVAAAAAACNDAGLDPASPELSGSSAVLGTTHASSAFCEAYYGEIVTLGLGAANPALFAEGVPNAAAAHLSMALGIRGGCQTIIGTRCAGLEALILAAMRIRDGTWERAIVVAGEEFSAVVNRAYAMCRSIGPGISADGTSGAVALVLESAAAAAARGARNLGSLTSCAWGASIDGVDRHLGIPPRVWSALATGGPDREAAGALDHGRAAARHATVRNRLPECFSMGPLAALICGFVDFELASGDFGVVAREFTGRACGVRIIRS